MELVTELSQLAKNDIMLNAGNADEFEQTLAIYSETQVIPMARSKYTSSDKIVNNNPKSVFTEFGYGIVGQGSPYTHEDVFNMSNAGWEGYNLPTSAKRLDGSWWYTDMFGNKHYTKGAYPKNIFFNAYEQVRTNALFIANKIFGRVGK